jgi:DNA-binding transcriptional ArsR family regulator
VTADRTKAPKGLRDLDEVDAVFTALAHKSRRHILQVLVARDGTLTAGELSARFAHSWPTTSRHLGVLLDAGIVSVATAGRQRHYRIEREHLGDVLALWLRSVGLELRPLSGRGEDAS